jgi:predicted dinucleotide-binding enzyme
MKVTVIGYGNMGSAFAKRLAATGHEVVLTGRNLDKARQKAAALGPKVRIEEPGRAAAGAELVIATAPYAEQVAAIRALGPLGATPLVEISNPLKPDMSGLEVGTHTSAAEEIAKALPGVKVVKAFNTLFAALLADAPKTTDGKRFQVLIAGDDAGAKRTVMTLGESLGFEPVDAGPLMNARNLEPIAMQNIWFAYVGKQGPKVGPGWGRTA